MKIHNLEQGSPEWLEAREKWRTASEATAMMGEHPTVSRNDLLRANHDGMEKEVSRYVREQVFEKGHRVEAQARPIAEEIIGKELYPATVTDDEERLSASLDGAPETYTVTWECKQWNKDKAEMVEQGGCPACDYPQVQQQLMVTGAEKCLYMVTDGTKGGTVTCWVYPDTEYQQKIVAGWDQFEKDLADYTPPKDAPAAVGAKKADLPALRVEVEGKVLATNVDQFRDHALAVFDSISTDLQDDQDFADAEETVKWCKGVEDQLEGAKKQALAQTASIDDLFRAIDEIRETARQKRLDLKKRVDSRKGEIRTEIADEARAKFAEHMKALSDRVRPVGMPSIPTDFAAAMKGKRTIKSLRDAVDQVLADAKLEANAIADRIDSNLRAYNELADGHETLFPDLSTLAQKEPDDFQAAVKLRIAEHQEAEAKREEARRRHEAEEQARRDAGKCDGNHGGPPCADPECWNDDHTASEKAGAAMQQQAEAAQAAAPEPPVEKSGTGGKAQGTERWRITATFEVEWPAGATAETMAASLKRQLLDRGFQSVTGAVAEKQKEAA